MKQQRSKNSSYSTGMDDSPGMDVPPPPPINDTEYGNSRSVSLFFSFPLFFDVF
jgi:hypothetical protein